VNLDKSGNLMNVDENSSNIDENVIKLDALIINHLLN
jgi:hypothetical protein